MKKVLIIGETLELGRTEEVYGRQFSAFGSQVEHFIWKESAPSLYSRSFLDRLARRVAWQPLAKLANRKLVETANQFKPDLTLVISPLLLHPDSILAIKQHGSAFVFFTDNPLDTQLSVSIHQESKNKPLQYLLQINLVKYYYVRSTSMFLLQESHMF